MNRIWPKKKRIQAPKFICRNIRNNCAAMHKHKAQLFLSSCSRSWGRPTPVVCDGKPLRVAPLDGSCFMPGNPSTAMAYRLQRWLPKTSLHRYFKLIHECRGFSLAHCSLLPYSPAFSWRLLAGCVMLIASCILIFYWLFLIKIYQHNNFLLSF